MDKLIITVTVDSRLTWPNTPHCPVSTDTKAVAQEYIRSVEAGAAIVHTHGSYEKDPTVPDGRRLIKEGWLDIVERIRSQCHPVIQAGLAGRGIKEKSELWDLIRADMNSTAFNAHDEYFHPDPAYPPRELLKLHPIAELKEYARAANEHGVKLEIEAFHTGAFWHIHNLRKEPGILPDPLWITLFIGWPGGSWTPPTSAALQNLVAHLPARANWNMSCMAPEQYWGLIGLTIVLGGHIRIGMEDCPYLEDGTLYKSNAQAVEKAVRMAREMGRQIASPEEARNIIGLKSRR